MLCSSLKFLLLACVVCSVAACGQKGDLVKPGTAPAKAAATEVVR